MLTPKQQRTKRVFDIVVAVVGLVITWPIIMFAWVAASIETKSNGIFSQERVGRYGKRFRVYKIKTMRPIEGYDSTVTTSEDKRITKSGAFFRRIKIDELPQLWNVLKGEMSFVGPRPDVPGFADKLEGEDRVILELRPGITGPASLKYKNEEELLTRQEEPERYNREVIWPDKVEINKRYLYDWSLKKDIIYLLKTLTS